MQLFRRFIFLQCAVSRVASKVARPTDSLTASLTADCCRLIMWFRDLFAKVMAKFLATHLTLVV